jgi:hypothetical protein
MHTVALTLQFDDLGMMQEAIQDSPGSRRIYCFYIAQ